MVDVVSTAKRDLREGEVLHAIGWYMTDGQVEKAAHGKRRVVMEGSPNCSADGARFVATRTSLAEHGACREGIEEGARAMRQRRHGWERAVSPAEGGDEASPLVSVGLPVFNGAAFLTQALDSVLAQTYTNFELIISDNASTDATPDILREYSARDPRIRILRQASNIGVAHNQTMVAREARGTLFKWVFANDEFAPTLLADCVAVMQGDPSVVLCYGRTQFIDLAGKRLEVYQGDFAALSADPLERYRIVRKRLHLCTAIQGGLIRRPALQRCGYMGNYPCSDRVLLAGLALEGMLVLLPQILFYRRWGPLVATALRTPLEIARLYHPDATRPFPLADLRRRLAQVVMALRVPRDWRSKVRSVWTALRCTEWNMRTSRRFPSLPSDPPGATPSRSDAAA